MRLYLGVDIWLVCWLELSVVDFPGFAPFDFDVLSRCFRGKK